MNVCSTPLAEAIDLVSYVEERLERDVEVCGEAQILAAEHARFALATLKMLQRFVDPLWVP